jgi:hypothetical protein
MCDRTWSAASEPITHMCILHVRAHRLAWVWNKPLPWMHKAALGQADRQACMREPARGTGTRAAMLDGGASHAGYLQGWNQPVTGMLVPW